MPDRQDAERRQTISCSGNLGLYCWLRRVENTTPTEVVENFHKKAELVRQYAAKIFDDVEEDAEVDSVWDSETYEDLY